MSEYNPFDGPPPGIDISDATAKPKALDNQVQPAPTVEPPHTLAPPGRAPLAGQASSGLQLPPMPNPHGIPRGPAASSVRADLPPQADTAPAQAVPGVQYDLAGNPLPPSFASTPPAAPPPPYGYSPGPTAYAPPASGYAPGPSSTPMIVPAGMEEAMTGGANWMIGIVLLTLASIWLTKLTYPVMMPYISYAAISGVIDFTMLLGIPLGYTTAAILGSIALLPLALLAVLGFKRQAWVFVIAMVVYGFDIPITIITWILHLSLWGIVLGTAWHSFVFQRMFAAWTAAREINATMAGLRK